MKVHVQVAAVGLVHATEIAIEEIRLVIVQYPKERTHEGTRGNQLNQSVEEDGYLPLD